MLGCGDCGGTCGCEKPPLDALKHFDFSGIGRKGMDETIVRDLNQVKGTASSILILQAIASLAAAGVFYIQWRTYCDSKKKSSRSKR